MGAAAVPIIGQIIVSVVVSKVASSVASSIGLSDSAAGLIGVGVGLWAGGVTAASMNTPTAGAAAAADTSAADGFSEGVMRGGVPDGGATAIPLDAGGGAGMLSRNIAPGAGPVAPSAAPPAAGGSTIQPTSTSMVGGPPGGPSAARPTPMPASSGPIVQPTTTASPPPSSSTLVPGSPSTVPPASGGSWWDKLWESDRTVDTLVGAAGGMAQGVLEGKAVEDQYKAQYAREDELSNRWANHNYTGPTIKYPSHQSGMLTRGSS